MHALTTGLFYLAINFLRKDVLNEFQIQYPAYLDLYTPAVDWILSCVAHKAPKVLPATAPAARCHGQVMLSCCVCFRVSSDSQETLRAILDRYTAHIKDALVLDSIMTSFPAEYIADHAILFTELIRNADATAYPQVQRSERVITSHARQVLTNNAVALLLGITLSTCSTTPSA